MADPERPVIPYDDFFTTTVRPSLHVLCETPDKAILQPMLFLGTNRIEEPEDLRGNHVVGPLFRRLEEEFPEVTYPFKLVQGVVQISGFERFIGIITVDNNFLFSLGLFDPRTSLLGKGYRVTNEDGDLCLETTLSPTRELESQSEIEEQVSMPTIVLLASRNNL